jgi:hypothetical protein
MDTLDILPLTAPRQDMLTGLLGGHALRFDGDTLAQDARRSLETIGLSPVEIAALEAANPGKPAALVPTAKPDPHQGNPWSREHFNLTEQGRIVRDDPTLAQKLKAQAGAV